ncbi:potassium channel family protein [Marinobacter sp. NFXS9]|uniref:potassium channel family protein n=1 Tax=Marinobacter sp. NFXS9 TaxID=2818433 RepID=UPI0032DED67C
MFLRLFQRRRVYTRFTRRLQNDMRTRLLRAAGWLALLSGLHVLAMLYFEQLTIGDALWLTVTTLTTVGYGDLSASTAMGRLCTTLLLYIAGITLLAELASDYIDFRIKRKDHMIKGLWRWDMSDHILIINSPKANAALYFERLVGQIRAADGFSEAPVQLLTDAFPNGLPTQLREMGVVHYHGSPSEQQALAATTPAAAKAIIVLAGDEYKRASDSITLDVLLQLSEMCEGHPPYTVAECVQERNRPRLERAGANTTIRPVRAYPEILVRSIVAPGAEKILENLFTHQDDHTLRFDIPLSDATWSTSVCRLMEKGLGTLLAYVDDLGHVQCHPAADHRFDACALIMMVHEDRIPTEYDVREALGATD